MCWWVIAVGIPVIFSLGALAGAILCTLGRPVDVGLYRTDAHTPIAMTTDENTSRAQSDRAGAGAMAVKTEGCAPGTNRLVTASGCHEREMSKTVLLADDDSLSLEVLSRMLSSIGYTVQGVANGKTALDIFSREPYGYSLVLLDQIMHGVTGIDVAEALLKIRSDIPILLISGCFLSDRTMLVAEEVGIRKILTKPIDIDQLEQAIRTVAQ